MYTHHTLFVCTFPNVTALNPFGLCAAGQPSKLTCYNGIALMYMPYSDDTKMPLCVHRRNTIVLIGGCTILSVRVFRDQLFESYRTDTIEQASLQYDLLAAT